MSNKRINLNDTLRIHAGDIPKERKPQPPPTRPHEKRKYSRNIKHKGDLRDEVV